MNKPFIQQAGKIYYLPVIRQRLNFAVLVRRVITELTLDSSNLLITVALPESLYDKIVEAIHKLPEVNLILVSTKAENQREVFPVTPCDGIVEAIRLAEEKDIPLKFIDQEIAPKHLINRHCIHEPNWPDDGLILKQGAEWYLDLIQEYLSHPPMRFEPVDTWREIYMTNQLRKYLPYYRRILLVCDAQHIEPIKKLLQEPMQFIDEGTYIDRKLPPVRYEIEEPKLEILLYYLDDIPGLVENYETYRANAEFDKRDALLKIVHELSQQAEDLNLSIRNYQAFVQLLTNMMDQEKKFSLSLEKILLASSCCFSKPFTERLRRKLLSYYDQVDVERIGEIHSDRWEIQSHVSQANFKESVKNYVLRSCNPMMMNYTPLPDESPPGGEGPAERNEAPSENESEDVITDIPELEEIDELFDTPLIWKDEEPQPKPAPFVWPEWLWNIDRMRKKAYGLIKSKEVTMSSSRYRGSIGAGIDIRRTLKSYFKRKPEIYIREYSASKKSDIEKAEPVVWIFEDKKIDEKKCKLTIIFDCCEDSPKYTEALFYGSDRENIPLPNSDFKVEYQKIMGMITFCDGSLTVKQLKEVYGKSLNKRIPKYENFLVEIPFRSEKYVKNGKVWWELFLLSALDYAQKDVVCILPPGLVIPQDIVQFGTSHKKTLHRIPLSKFTLEEQRKLRTIYTIFSSDIMLPYDLNDPNFLGEIMTRYGTKMKQCWE